MSGTDLWRRVKRRSVARRGGIAAGAGNTGTTSTPLWLTRNCRCCGNRGIWCCRLLSSFAFGLRGCACSGFCLSALLCPAVLCEISIPKRNSRKVAERADEGLDSRQKVFALLDKSFFQARSDSRGLSPIGRERDASCC